MEGSVVRGELRERKLRTEEPSDELGDRFAATGSQVAVCRLSKVRTLNSPCYQEAGFKRK